MRAVLQLQQVTRDRAGKVLCLQCGEFANVQGILLIAKNIWIVAGTPFHASRARAVLAFTFTFAGREELILPSIRGTLSLARLFQ